MLSSLRTKTRMFGIADTLWLALDKVLRRLSLGAVQLVKYYVVAQPVRVAGIHSASNFRMYVTESIDDIIAQAPRPQQTLLDRFAQQSRCVVAECDGQLAGFIWLCPNSYREDVLRCVYTWVPSPTAVWDYDVYIAPAFRMGRLFARLWAYAHALLAAENVGWTLSRIDAFNPGSLAAHRRLGALTLARLWFLTIGRMQVTFSTTAPLCHLSMREGRGPRPCFDLSQLRDRDRGRASDSSRTSQPRENGGRQGGVTL
jgi:hypothetical protein